MVEKILFTRLNARPWDDDFARLPPVLRQRILKYVHQADRLARIAGWVLIEKILHTLTGRDDVLKNIEYTSAGRPFLPSYPSLDFNLSHSGDLIVCGALDGGRIGVDVEQVRPIELDDGRCVFSADIMNVIERSDDPQSCFFQAWTRMEAVAKAEGFGVGGPVQSIRFDDGVAQFEGRRWHLLEIPLDQGYSCHVASSRPISLSIVEEY